MNNLLTHVSDFSGQLKRNIINLGAINHVFDDILNESTDPLAAESLILQTRHQMNFAHRYSDFYYTAAIAYPFETEPFISTRYSDGSFPAWYGSLDMDTTVYETVYHMKKSIGGIENIKDEKEIIRKRTVFNIKCQGLLVDVQDKKKAFPELISNEHTFCQALGKRISQSGYPGLLSPSARCHGINANIFTPDILSSPQVHKELIYVFNTRTESTSVFHKNRCLMII